MNLSVTGHQPPLLGGFTPEVDIKLFNLPLTWLLPQQSVNKVISGLAPGWDWAVARAAKQLGIPLVAALSHSKQGHNWPIEAKQQLDDLLTYATVHIHDGVFKNQGQHIKDRWKERDHWVVDHGDVVLALWNGQTEGGAANAVRYALSEGKQVINLWDDWCKL